jgi:hypothetical protein
VRIEPFDFDAVVQDVAAHLGCVGEKRWHHHILKFSGSFQARTFFIAAMWFMRAVPEAKRTAFGPRGG